MTLPGGALRSLLQRVESEWEFLGGPNKQDFSLLGSIFRSPIHRNYRISIINHLWHIGAKRHMDTRWEEHPKPSRKSIPSTVVPVYNPRTFLLGLVIWERGFKSYRQEEPKPSTLSPETYLAEMLIPRGLEWFSCSGCGLSTVIKGNTGSQGRLLIPAPKNTRFALSYLPYDT